MSQIITKFIQDGAVLSGALASHGKIGSGAATATSALFADGSGGTSFRTILSTDIPTLNQNTTGTAANITATTNATLTTLSALTTAGSLAISGSQVSGGTFGAVNGSALTNLSAAALSGLLPVGVTGGSGLSIATGQLIGYVSLTSQVSGVLPIANGGTDNGLLPVTAGGVLYTDGTKFQNVGAGSAGQVLTSNGASAPTWTAAASGTVTSVALADGSTTPIYNISGSPVTSTGTLDFTLKTQTANTVFAGPTTGSAAQPTFRALVSADIPSLSATYVTQSEVGAASGVASLDGTGKIPIAQLPSSVMEFQGGWNPNTNTPTLVDGTGVNGYTYYVTAADSGTVAGLADPSMYNFQIGDLVIYNGTAWQLVSPANGVQSVNAAQGAVVMSMATANGFAGTYSGTALTVSTTLTTPVVAANGTALIAGTTTGTGSTVVLATSPTLVTPALGTPSALVGTNITGTAAGLTAGTVTTNANLTGDVTSVGNATSLVATSNATLTTLSALTTASSLASVGTITSGTWNGTTIAIAHGGTGQTTAAAAYNALSPMTTTGDIEYEASANTAARLPIGSTGQVLTVVSGIPAWSSPAASPTWNKETFNPLTSGQITAQSITLAHTPLANSVSFLVVGAGDQLEGIDFTVTGAVVAFIGGLATGGASALTTSDIVQIQYQY
jgi:hypothetical protein